MRGARVNSIDFRGDSTGFGDVMLLAQWRFLNDMIGGTQAAVLFGVKAPTGTTNLFDQLGELFETEFQPGFRIVGLASGRCKGRQKQALRA